MPSKRIIAAIAGAALLVGAVVSGCNRNLDRDAIAAKRSRRPVKTTPSVNSDLAQASIARPAEVLAATVRRPSRPTQVMRRARRNDATMHQDYYQNAAYLSPQAAAELARYEPLPEPVPLSALHNQSATAYAPGVVHGSPELTMARAALTPVAIPEPAPRAAAMVRLPGDFVVPPIDPGLFAAPIPELEPVLYQQRPAAPVQQLQVPRLPALPHRAQQQTQQRPPWERQDVSAAPPAPVARRDAMRALEPIAQSQPRQSRKTAVPAQAATRAGAQDWVPSPATAMSGR